MHYLGTYSHSVITWDQAVCSTIILLLGLYLEHNISLSRIVILCWLIMTIQTETEP